MRLRRRANELRNWGTKTAGPDMEDLIQFLLTLYLYGILIRLLLTFHQADFYNPISQVLARVTDPVYQPVRRIRAVGSGVGPRPAYDRIDSEINQPLRRRGHATGSLDLGLGTVCTDPDRRDDAEHLPDFPDRGGDCQLGHSCQVAQISF